jgi:hypothetical protein
MSDGTPGRVLMLHAQFEAQNLDEARAEEEYEQYRQAAHVQKHGSLDGYTPVREFPCAGMLRTTDEDGPMATVACDACPYVTTYRCKPAARTEEATW